MKRRHPLRGRKRAAFTLVEVLLVLTIIVVIAGFGIRNLMGSFDTAKIRQGKATVQMISSALESYRINVGSLPSSLDALYEQPSDIPDPSMWVQELKQPVPLDPWNNPYELKVEGNKFEVRSMGPDGQSGTADDITSS